MEIKIIIERSGNLEHAYVIYLPVVTDDQFMTEINNLAVFTYVSPQSFGHKSSVFVQINPVIGVAEAERQIKPLVGALMMRNGAPEGVSFEKSGGTAVHGYDLYLPVKTDDEFIAELNELAVFAYVSSQTYGHKSSVFVQINPVIGVAAAKRQIMPLVKNLCKRASAKTHA